MYVFTSNYIYSGFPYNKATSTTWGGWNRRGLRKVLTRLLHSWKFAWEVKGNTGNTMVCAMFAMWISIGWDMKLTKFIETCRKFWEEVIGILRWIEWILLDCGNSFWHPLVPVIGAGWTQLIFLGVSCQATPTRWRQEYMKYLNLLVLSFILIFLLAGCCMVWPVFAINLPSGKSSHRSQVQRWIRHKPTRSYIHPEAKTWVFLGHVLSKGQRSSLFTLLVIFL